MLKAPKIDGQIFLWLELVPAISAMTAGTFLMVEGKFIEASLATSLVFFIMIQPAVRLYERQKNRDD